MPRRNARDKKSQTPTFSTAYKRWIELYLLGRMNQVSSVGGVVGHAVQSTSAFLSTVKNGPMILSDNRAPVSLFWP